MAHSHRVWCEDTPVVDVLVPRALFAVTVLQSSLPVMKRA
jgi:hypothetical protein